MSELPTHRLDYAAELRTGAHRIGVWGLGPIGASTLVQFTRVGAKCVGFDTNIELIYSLNGERPVISALPGGTLGSEIITFLKAGIATITGDQREMEAADILVHVICVPTERRGNPTADVVRQVCDCIAKTLIVRPRLAPLVIIESTMTPGSTNSLLVPTFQKYGLESGRDFLICVSPRRDWFDSNGLRSIDLDRVYGGTDPRSLEAGRQVLSMVCRRLHAASTPLSAELVKCVENSYRFVDITFANQLAVAFPKVDTGEVLRLAGTKWNLETFVPGIRPGGHCVPVAARHLIQGAQHPEYLSLVSTAIDAEQVIADRVVQAIKVRNIGQILLLGFSYRRNIKVSVFSPAIELVVASLAAGLRPTLCDPKFSIDELELEGGCPAVDVDRISEFPALLLLADHAEFCSDQVRQSLTDPMFAPRFVLDCTAAWSKWRFPPTTEYRSIGDAKLFR